MGRPGRSLVIRFGQIPSDRMRTLFTAALGGCVLMLAGAAHAQQPFDLHAASQEQLSDTHFKLVGQVEVSSGDATIYADAAEVFSDESRVIATGNVVLTQGANRIAGDRADYNYKTHLGTFYNATGLATVQTPSQRGATGFVAPQMTNQQTDVMFFGETIEKIGFKKYRITKGGFTTCMQPTPRWQLTSDSVILNIDHYTFLRNAIFTVKGVPMLYLPAMYYPTKKENRATGFLIPTYGSSTLRGQAIHNAFFWAINRSQDATFLHDWFSTTGQGAGGEYRYNYGAGANGTLRAYMLDDHEATYTQDNGVATSVPASRSYEVRGGANQQLPYGLRARANVDYFSNLVAAQTFNTNIYDASRRQRTYGGNIVGAWGSYTLNTTIDWNEFFYGVNSSTVSGDTPRINFTRSERPLFGSPIYFTVSTEYATLVRRALDTAPGAGIDVDSGLSRFDLSPQIRYPFKKWEWLTVNSTLAWRDTYYSRSVDPAANSPQVLISEAVNRQFFDFQSQFVGPVFTRIWNTPDNGYAEKFKHTIEPFFTLRRTSNIGNFGLIPQLDATDAVVGGVTQYNYGVNNRFYAKRKEGRLSQAREILSVELTQTYYTDPRASQFDIQYATSMTGATPSNFSPLALSIRAVPTNEVNATFRAEFDSKYRSLRTISTTATYNWSARLNTTVGWSKKNYIPELAGFNDPRSLDQYLNANTNVHTRDNRVGGAYTFNYDILHSSFLQQQFTGFYNAQCCGIALQYQTFNYGGLGSLSPIPADHRFFLSFTLAGIGNFSPFNGAMSNVPR